jgi:hypothetical protein
MSNYLRGLGRAVRLTEDTRENNASRTSSYVEVHFLQGSNTQGRVPQLVEGD